MTTHRCLGVVGCGFVGSAACLLRNPDVCVLAYDLQPEACDPLGTTLQDVANADAIMVAVPTPMDPITGAADTSIVEKVVENIRNCNPDALVILRSTVPPGTCERLGVCFMPEFLTEASPEENFRATPQWIVGTPAGVDRTVVAAALCPMLEAARKYGCIASSDTLWMSATETEFVKYFRNCFLATKVAFCNEIASLCAAKGVSYDAVRGAAACDPRITFSHTAVPGPDGRRGYGGTCFPKDTHGLRASFREAGVACPLLDASARRNEEIDRPERDWLEDVGRAVAATKARDD
jgi:nucleotide sugar dehydrogenase